MAFLADPLPGFDAATQALDSLVADDLQYLALEVCKSMVHKGGKLSPEDLAGRLSGGGEERERNRPSTEGGGATSRVRQAINACFYIFREAVNASVGADELGGLLEEGTDLSDASRSVLSRVWQTKSPQLMSSHKVATKVSVGKLVGMEWKLSIATASSSCSNLMSPYVALLLTVANADGKQKTVPLEMTLPEFEEFAKGIDEIANVLDTV